MFSTALIGQNHHPMQSVVGNPARRTPV
ncbi:protein of unknown function [Burkholderia multivorans]